MILTHKEICLVAMFVYQQAFIRLIQYHKTAKCNTKKKKRNTNKIMNTSLRANLRK